MSQNSFEIHWRDVRVKRLTNRKMISFGVELYQRQEEEGPKEIVKLAEQDGRQVDGEAEGCGVFNKPSCGASLTVPRGKCPGCAWGGTC